MGRREVYGVGGRKGLDVWVGELVGRWKGE